MRFVRGWLQERDYKTCLMPSLTGRDDDNKLLLILPWIAASILGCHTAEAWRTMKVTATAYTLAKLETSQDHVDLGAWGDHLKPGDRTVAVSRDLVAQGLTHGAKVKIDGLSGVYTVRDKMNKRWHSRIDILMDDKSRALKWGKQQITIQWRPPSTP